MLSRHHRLTRQTDILAIMRGGQKIVTPYVVVYAQRTSSPTRVACIVGKKIEKSSVRRHALQRKLRVAAAEVVKCLPRGFDMVWLSRPLTKTLRHASQLNKDTRLVIEALTA